MEAQIFLQQKLRERLLEIQTRNPTYSMRAFARKLSLNPGIVSSLLNGKRNVSLSTALHIAEALNFDPQERAHLTAGLPDRKRRHAAARAVQTYSQLSADQFHVISTWHHFAILSLIKTKSFRPDEAWIARRLGIKVPEVQAAVERLFRLGFVVKDEHGAWKRQSPQYRTPDDVANASVRKYHAQTLELAQRALETRDVHERDLASVTCATDPAKLPEAKVRIRKFQDELTEFLESGAQTEVFTFATQLIPLTQGDAT